MTNFFRQLTRIKYSNLRIWWKELLLRDDFWKQIFNYRLLWGAFNIHSHQRRSDGKNQHYIQHTEESRQGSNEYAS